MLLIPPRLVNPACTASKISLIIDFPEYVLSIAILCFKKHLRAYSFKIFYRAFPKPPRRLMLGISECALHTENESSWILFLPSQCFPRGWPNWLIFDGNGPEAYWIPNTYWQSILTLYDVMVSWIVDFLRLYSFDKETVVFMSTAYFQFLSNRHNFPFVLFTAYINIRTKWWARHHVWNDYVQEWKYFWTIKRFGRWNIWMISVWIKEVTL